MTPGEVLVAGTTFIAGTNPVPTTAEGTFLYDTDGGTGVPQLYWDADGTNGGAAVLIANFLNTADAVTTADFLIV